MVFGEDCTGVADFAVVVLIDDFIDGMDDPVNGVSSHNGHDFGCLAGELFFEYGLA